LTITRSCKAALPDSFSLKFLDTEKAELNRGNKMNRQSILVLTVFCLFWLLPLLFDVGNLYRYAFEEIRVLVVGFILPFLGTKKRYVCLFFVLWLIPLLVSPYLTLNLVFEEMRVLAVGFVLGFFVKKYLDKKASSLF
jgi:hypothetical protein